MDSWFSLFPYIKSPHAEIGHQNWAIVFLNVLIVPLGFKDRNSVKLHSKKLGHSRVSPTTQGDDNDHDGCELFLAPAFGLEALS